MADDKREEGREPLIDWATEPTPASSNFVFVQHSPVQFAAVFGDVMSRPMADRSDLDGASLRTRLVASLRWAPPEFFSAIAALASNWNKFIQSVGAKGPLFQLINSGDLPQLEGLDGGVQPADTGDKG
jgi:hypothetical protein